MDWRNASKQCTNSCAAIARSDIGNSQLQAFYECHAIGMPYRAFHRLACTGAIVRSVMGTGATAQFDDRPHLGISPFDFFQALSLGQARIVESKSCHAARHLKPHKFEWLVIARAGSP